MRSLLLTVALPVALSASAESTASSGESAAVPYEVIVNSHNPATFLDRDFVADAFLKKTTIWPNGEPIRPVDLAASSAVRASFSEAMLHRSVAEVKLYWQQRIFSGRDIPPPEFDRDHGVVEYVQKHEGAIGYVSVGVVPDGARIVMVK